MTPELGRTLLSAIEILDGLGLRYAVVGGLAIGAWGVNRSTRDVDLYADLPSTERAALERALNVDFAPWEGVESSEQARSEPLASSRGETRSSPAG